MPTVGQYYHYTLPAFLSNGGIVAHFSLPRKNLGGDGLF